MSNSSVVVDGVSKKFGLSLKSALKYGMFDGLRRMSGVDSVSRLRPGEFWAIQGISFTLEPGDALGIMGVNGSGKTTLLRILNGTYSPDAGKVTMRGRVGALIAAGAGFSPMLSGRENIFVSGALLGMKPSEIRKRFDDIVSYAELENFIDMPVRNYSSGMSVRLGFSIAVISAPEILLVDEVLAVGDISFQKKCYEKIHELRRQGTTILLVSHSIGAIWAVCNKGLLLHEGNPTVYGDIESVCKAYEDQNSRSAQISLGERVGNIPAQDCNTQVVGTVFPAEYGHHRGGDGIIYCRGVRVLSICGRERKEIEFGEPFVIEFEYTVRGPVASPIFRSSLDAVHQKFVVSFDSYEQGYSFDTLEPGNYTFRMRVDEQNLRPGLYVINTSVISRGSAAHLFYWLSANSFVVLHPINRFLYSNDQAIFFLPANMKLRRM